MNSVNNIIRSVKLDIKKVVTIVVQLKAGKNIKNDPKDLPSFRSLTNEQFSKFIALIKVLNAHLEEDNYYTPGMSANNKRYLNNFKGFYGNSINNHIGNINFRNLQEFNQTTSSRIKLITKFIISKDELTRPIILSSHPNVII